MPALAECVCECSCMWRVYGKVCVLARASAKAGAQPAYEQPDSGMRTSLNWIDFSVSWRRLKPSYYNKIFVVEAFNGSVLRVQYLFFYNIINNNKKYIYIYLYIHIYV